MIRVNQTQRKERPGKWFLRICILLPNWRPHLTRQRPQNASPSPQTGRSRKSPLPRLTPHLRNHGTAKRRGCENPLRTPRTLLRGLYPRYLRPHHPSNETGCSRKSRFLPLRYPLTLSVTNSRMGHGMGQPKPTPRKKFRKTQNRPEAEVSGLFFKNNMKFRYLSCYLYYKLLHSLFANFLYGDSANAKRQQMRPTIAKPPRT